MEDLSTLAELSDEQLLERLGAEVWQERQHAFPASPAQLRREATAWLNRNRAKICDSPSVTAIRQNADVAVLAGAILDVFDATPGVPAPSVVAVLITRMGLNRFCGASPTPDRS